jgi:hypothetical protein
MILTVYQVFAFPINAQTRIQFILENHAVVIINVKLVSVQNYRTTSAERLSQNIILVQETQFVVVEDADGTSVNNSVFIPTTTALFSPNRWTMYD